MKIKLPSKAKTTAKVLSITNGIVMEDLLTAKESFEKSEKRKAKSIKGYKAKKANPNIGVPIYTAVNMELSIVDGAIDYRPIFGEGLQDSEEYNPEIFGNVKSGKIEIDANVHANYELVLEIDGKPETISAK